MPEELTTLIERLNHELDLIEQEASDGIQVANAILEQFPDNFVIIQLFAFLNSSLFFVNTSRQRIQRYLNYLSNTEILQQDKNKVTVIRIKARLENLR